MAPRTLLEGRVITMDPRMPEARAVGIDGDRIAAVGKTAEVAAALGEGAERVDLGDAAILPAFIDAHHHFCMAAFDRGTPDLHLPAGSTVADVLALVERAARERPGGGWLRLQGYDPAKLAERRAPRREEIDEVAPDRPCLLIAYSFHDACANSAALAAMGWDDASPDPPNGRLRRRRGRLTGELVEGAFFLAEARSRDALLETAEDAWMAECEAHGRELLAAGIARVGDAAVPPSFERLYERAAAAGKLPVIVHRMPVASASVIEPRLDGEPTGSGPPGTPVGPAKLFMDGAERCALCVSVTQYVRGAGRVIGAAAGGEGLAAIRASAKRAGFRLEADRHLHYGIRFWEQEALDAAVVRGLERGFQLAQHALGNEGIDMALTAIDRAGAAIDRAPGRPRLEHAMFIHDELVARIAAAGAVAVVQPHFLHDFVGDLFSLTPLPPPLRVAPLRSMIDAGVTLAGSSDYPVSGFDVLAAIRAAATRATVGGRIFEPDQAIAIEEALRAYTAGSALALGVEDEAGTLAPGKRADVTVLSGDPRTTEPERLTDLSVLRTYVGGRLAHH